MEKGKKKRQGTDAEDPQRRKKQKWGTRVRKKKKKIGAGPLCRIRNSNAK